MKDESPEDRLKERQEQAKPLLDAFDMTNIVNVISRMIKYY